jgi:hypothetical protein
MLLNHSYVPLPRSSPAETSSQIYLPDDGDPEVVSFNFPFHINDSYLGSGLKIKKGFQ